MSDATNAKMYDIVGKQPRPIPKNRGPDLPETPLKADPALSDPDEVPSGRPGDDNDTGKPSCETQVEPKSKPEPNPEAEVVTTTMDGLVRTTSSSPYFGPTGTWANSTGTLRCDS